MDGFAQLKKFPATKSLSGPPNLKWSGCTGQRRFPETKNRARWTVNGEACAMGRGCSMANSGIETGKVDSPEKIWTTN